jgi:hypothetical protein
VALPPVPAPLSNGKYSSRCVVLLTPLTGVRQARDSGVAVGVGDGLLVAEECEHALRQHRGGVFVVLGEIVLGAGTDNSSEVGTVRG